ncbi:MAG: sugar phosphate isomerase/epimerase [Treponema sp.]|jgi:sugar phosphate isomerase/epimerase|nr:sugar phosphate isomerase/epimerase [Treponema sp.]
MLLPGIFTGYYPYTIDEVIKRIKASDFSCVQLDVSFKDCDAAKEQLSKQKANEIRDKFRNANLPIVAVSGYTNLIHPDPGKRKANIAYIKMMMERAMDLGCPYVASETGTYNRDSDWVWDDHNASEAAYQETCEIIYDITKFAREHGAVYIVENYVNNVIGSVEQVLRLFKDINLPNIKLLCDPTNYFDESNIDYVDVQLRRIFDALGDKMVMAHAKDCKRAASSEEKHAAIDADESHTFRGSGAVELPAAGLGVLNYDLYVKLLAKDHPNMPIIIEHLDENDIGRAQGFLKDVLKKQGV